MYCITSNMPLSKHKKVLTTKSCGPLVFLICLPFSESPPACHFLVHSVPPSYPDKSEDPYTSMTIGQHELRSMPVHLACPLFKPQMLAAYSSLSLKNDMPNPSFWSSSSLQNEMPEVQSHRNWRLPRSLYKICWLRSGVQNHSILLKIAWTSKMSIYTECNSFVFCSGLDPTHLVVKIGTRIRDPRGWTMGLCLLSMNQVKNRIIFPRREFAHT